MRARPSWPRIAVRAPRGSDALDDFQKDSARGASVPLLHEDMVRKLGVVDANLGMVQSPRRG